MEPLQIAVSLLLFSSVAFLIWALFRFPAAAAVGAPAHQAFAQAVGAGRRKTVFEQRTLGPVMGLALAIAQRLGLGALRGRVSQDLAASGNPNGYSVDEYLAIALTCGAALGLVSTGLLFLLQGRVDLLVLLAMTALGFGVPIYTLHEAARKRVTRIAKQLPYTLDLIALMMGAGSMFHEAVEAIIRDDPEDALNQELRLVLAEVQFGSTRAAAMANMAGRIPLDSLRSVVGAANQAESLGTPLAGILKTQAMMLRMHRSVRAEKLSASASLRILLPSMLILMAVVATMFGPLIVRWARDGVALGM